MAQATAVEYQLPVVDETGDGYSYHHHYEVLDVLDPDAGPCAECGKPTVRLDVRQHVRHNGTEYTMRHDHVHAHADGSGPHGRHQVKPQLRCPRCLAYGQIEHRQEAYGDRWTCGACGHSEWHSIGD